MRFYLHMVNNSLKYNILEFSFASISDLIKTNIENLGASKIRDLGVLYISNKLKNYC